MGSVWQDLKYAVRGLARAPVFTLVAVLSLGLGIGVNTAIFSLLDQVLLRLLPVRNPEEIVLLNPLGASYGSNRGPSVLSYPMYQDLRDKNQVFRGVLAGYGLSLSVSFEGQTERVLGELVSGNYFEVLGVGAAAGRLIAPDDDRTPGGHPVAVLSYSYWQSRFGGQAGVVGRTLVVNNFPVTVIGVSQAGFEGVQTDRRPKIRLPMMMKAQMTPGWDDLKNRRSRWVSVLARLQPGVTAQQAKAALAPLYRQTLEMEVQQEAFRNATDYTRRRFVEGTLDVLEGSRGRSGMRQGAEKPLLLLMGMVAMVLVIACVNVANLLLARATARHREMAVRLALGGGRWRLIRQLLVESMLLAALGGVVGLGLAVWTARALLAILPPRVAEILSASVEPRTLAFHFAVALATGVLFGLAPAWQAVAGGQWIVITRAGLTVERKRLSRVLVTAQVALSLMLLIGAGLFVRSLRNLKNLDPGFRSDHLVTFSVDPALNGYRGERTFQFYRQLLEKVGAIPGVQSAALAAVAIMSNSNWSSSIAVEGYEAKPGENMNPWFNEVSPGYFTTLGIPLLRGRDFSQKDDRIAPKVCIVNEAFVKYYFGEQNPLGRRIGLGGNPGTKTDIEIVGVVRDAKYGNLQEQTPRQVLLPYLQAKDVFGMTVWARTAAPPEAVLAAVQRAVGGLDPHLPVYQLKTMETQLEESLVAERVVALLAGAFGLLATSLAVVGLYGVMAYNVARRTREIGIRIALGAEQRNLIWGVMREVLALVAIGMAVGLPAAWGLTRAVRSLLFGVEPTDPVTLLGAVAGMTVVACLAGLAPALRAARVDPIEALRYE